MGNENLHKVKNTFNFFCVCGENVKCQYGENAKLRSNLKTNSLSKKETSEGGEVGGEMLL